MHRSFRFTVIIVAGLGVVIWWQPGFAKAPPDTESVAAFRIVESVVMHPRCANCHSTDNWPTQGDDRHRHVFNVLRGDDGRGVTGMKCTTCHFDHNQDTGNVPGTKDWHMAPLSMGWAGLSGGSLCKALLDPAKNGGRSGEKVIEHLRADAVVLWAWNPGGKRTIPPVSHARFMEAAQTWIRKGAMCPSP